MLTIKKFLQLPEVQEALENENLDKVYGLYEDNCGTCASKVQLTQFFMDVGINVTEYMTVIGRYTFDTLPIKEVDVSENVQAIDNYAFINCRQLERIVLPRNLFFIDNNPFVNCPHLVIECYEGTLAYEWCKQHNREFRLIK